MKHLLTALCYRVLADELSQSTSLIDLIDGFNGPIDPAAEGALPVPLDFVTIWTREDSDKGEKGRARMGVLAPDGSLINQYLNYDIDITSTHKLRNVTKFAGFPFKGTGQHRVVVDLESADGTWVRQSEWPVMISAISPTKSSD